MPQPTSSPAPRESLTRRAGELATRATRRMEAEHQWFRELGAADRSWVALVAQAGIGSLLGWYADGSRAGPPGQIFAAAPPSLAGTITLAQTLDLTRTAIVTVEEAVPELVAADETQALREAVLRYSRDLAFAAAGVYARSADHRGGWDTRLETLVVHAVVRGEANDAMASRAAELGWEGVTDVAVVAGVLPQGDPTPVVEELRAAAGVLGRRCLTAAHDRRIVCVLGGSTRPVEDAERLVGAFGEGPVVVGPRVPHLFAAGRSARAALSGVDAAPAWGAAPRPVAADELLPERALLGEGPARRMLVDRVYAPLRDHPSALLDTVQAYLDQGMVLEASARLLFLHPNTVRYRLRRVEELVGLDPHTARDAWVLQVALALGRMGGGPRLWRGTR
ncbi:PucR family transcriptional regulator [Serinicoccus kebangsaanensis]|uniref:PucR family transcriptional regulator n=1 Tax=Serinicoccus kebangsaanensis TaxID=2602069 RepID=UPI001EE2AE16|nr:helix-turn-helix domain-containing protein [Serinicoccus kebangsaanensis]